MWTASGSKAPAGAFRVTERCMLRPRMGGGSGGGGGALTTMTSYFKCVTKSVQWFTTDSWKPFKVSLGQGACMAGTEGGH